MATLEEAISVALGIAGFDPAKITGWANDPETGWLRLEYDGDPGVSQTSLIVQIADVSTPEA